MGRWIQRHILFVVLGLMAASGGATWKAIQVTRLAPLEDDVRGLKDTHSELNRELGEAERALQQTEARLATAQDDVAQKESEKTRAEERQRASDRRATELERGLETLEAEEEQCREDKQHAEVELSKERDRVRALETQVAKQREDYAALAEESRTHQRRAEEAERKLQDATGRAQTLSTDLAAARHELQAASSRQSTDARQLSALRAALEPVEYQYKKGEKDCTNDPVDTAIAKAADQLIGYTELEQYQDRLRQIAAQGNTKEWAWKEIGEARDLLLGAIRRFESEAR